MTLHEKLVAIQSDLKAPKGQTNTFGKYKYRSCEDILEAVKPLLKEHGLTLHLLDEVVNIGTRFYVKATAIISDGSEGESGKFNAMQAVAYAREEEEKKGMDGAQITGAASSYARKYALNGLFCIDDTKDADTMDNTKSEKPKAAPRTPAKPVEKKQPTKEQAMEFLTNCKTPEALNAVYGRLMTYQWQESDLKDIQECMTNVHTRFTSQA